MDKPFSLLKSDKTPTALSAARVALLVFVSLVQPAHFAAAGEPLVKIGSIPLKDVEGRLDHLTFDNRSQHLFIAGLENHSVEVVDLTRRRRVHQITGISEPQGLLCIPEKNRLAGLQPGRWHMPQLRCHHIPGRAVG